MSQYLVVLFNDTDNPVQFVNREDEGDNRTIEAREMLRTKKHFNIPDDSDPSKWFDKRHMEIQDEQGNVLLSFWDNDLDNYNLKVCQKIDWKHYTEMPGFSNGGNQTPVGVIFSGDSANGFSIKAYQVLNNA
jgi:hypothetical protein